MAFPPGDGDDRTVETGHNGNTGGMAGMAGMGDIHGISGSGDNSNEETTVLPPLDGDPALVRPYVRVTEAAEADDPVEDEQAAASNGPAMWAADAEPTTILPPVPSAPTTPPAPTTPADPATPTASTGPTGLTGPTAPGRATGRHAAPGTALPLPESAEPAGSRRGKALALAGGAVALILLGTGAALLSRPSGTPAVQAAAPSTDATSMSPTASASASPSLSPSASPSHSPKPSPTPSKHPSPTASHSASPSASPPVSPSSPQSASPQSTSLSVGSTGSAVSTLQQDLHTLGLYRRSPSGYYDNRTAQAVATFQNRYNVQGDPSGVYGPNTQAAMAQALAGQGSGGNN